MTAIRHALRAYWRRLCRHPGVPIASICSGMGFAAGAHGSHWLRSGLLGFALMSLFWVPVLLTAWTDK